MDSGPKRTDDREATIRELHAKIGELTMERDLSTRFEVPRRTERVAMIDRGNELPLSRQCALLDAGRSSQYYLPLGESADNLVPMRRLDGLYLAYPFYGSRQIVRNLAREELVVGRHRVHRLMRLMGLEAIYRKPHTGVPNLQYRKYPYLLRDLVIDLPDQVWCVDITYIPV